MSRWLKVVLVVAALLVIAVATLFLVVHANAFQSLLEDQMSAALGRQVKFGNLNFSPFSGSLVANNLVVADDPAYSASPFLTAKQLRIGVEMGHLIFSRRLKVRSLTVESPQIHLIEGAKGRWNFSSIGENAASHTGTPQKESAFPGLTVGSLAIQNGRAVVEYQATPGVSRVYDHLDLSMRQFSFAKRFPFTLSADVPDNGRISASGQAGPINRQDAAMTYVDTQIKIRHLDPVAAGFLDPAAGVSLLADVDAHATSNGQALSSNGTVHMQRLRLVKTGAPTPNPVVLDYAVTQNLQDDDGQLQRADLQTGAVAIHIVGQYRLAPKNPTVNLKLDGEKLPIDQLQTLMKSAGVKLPNGATLRGGTLSLSLGINGPANNLVITGPVALDNTRMVGFDVGSKIAGIAALGRIKTGDTTKIEKLRLNLRASNSGISTTNIYALLPAVGQATGSGTVSPGGALDYHLVVKVTTAHGIGRAGVGLLTRLNSLAGSTAKGVAATGVPMRVTGTATDPVITANVKGLLRRNASSILAKGKKNNPGALLRGLFGSGK